MADSRAVDREAPLRGVAIGAGLALVAVALVGAIGNGPRHAEARGSGGASANARTLAVAPANEPTPPPLRRLLIPVEGVAAADLRDTFDEGRPGHRHEALDIPAPRGARVLAVDDGTVAKLFTSVPGGLTIYHFDRDQRFAYYYAHLDRYAAGLREGMALRRGDVIGYVGSTGNARADAPHLHFAVFRLGAEKRWWKGVAVNPFAALR